MPFSIKLQFVTCFAVTIIFYKLSLAKSIEKPKKMCNDIPENLLSEVLGGAYNSRYMSITPPDKLEEDEETYKREVGRNSFYVEGNYTKQIKDEPKWPWIAEKPAKEEAKTKHKRMTPSEIIFAIENSNQWRCQSKLRWIDLGPNYFPRYLRSVECLSDSCWFSHFKCKPRSFTVKLLKRRDDRCLLSKLATHSGTEGLPVELKEMWIWEERAVNFCCDCSL